MGRAGLAERIEEALPQTQCTRCGYPDCRSYARAIASDGAAINRCPPGGREGIDRLAALTGREPIALDPSRGIEGPRRLALIDESWCIGCTLCIKACPVDCIVGATKRMHTVIDELCTGCELCVPVCPVDCIAMVDVTAPATGWQAWNPELATQARERYHRHRLRLQREQREYASEMAQRAACKLADLGRQNQIADPAALERKRAIVTAALARAAPGAAPAGTDGDS